MVDIFAVIPFMTFISCLFIFAYVLGQRKKSNVNSAFLLYMLFMMLTPLIELFIHASLTRDIKNPLFQIQLVVILSLGFLFLNFVYTLLDKKRNAIFWLSFGTVITSIITIQLMPPMKTASFPGYGVDIPVLSVWFLPMLFLSSIIITGYALALCVVHIKNQRDIVLFRQLRLVIIGAIVSTPISIFALFIGPVLLNNYVSMRFASLSILVNVLFMFRAIQRHFLLSVNIEQIENSFNRLFENSKDSVFLLDKHGITIQMNKSAKKIMGVTVSSLDKSFLQNKISGYNFDIDGTDINATMVSDTETHFLQMSQSLVKQGDLSFGKLLIIRDITLQKKTEELLYNTKNIESIGQLAGGIAHDFNNFLCGIVSNITLAKLDLNPLSKTAELLSISEKTALQARDLTRQLLTFSKGDSIKIEHFDIVELLKEICNFMTHGSSANITCDLPQHQVFFKSDKGQIRQVFQNIVLNAFEAMPGGGRITISGKQITSKNDSGEDTPFFQISISDNGCGIKNENISRIFEPYFTTKSNGSGLGLAIVNSIVRKNNGSIAVESTIGEGTTFTIEFPVNNDITRQECNVPNVSVPLHSGRILIMDDYPTVRLSLALLLKKMGYQVDEATCGNEALKIYDQTISEQGSYDAVITDLTVPGAMGGKELADELHKLNPDLCIIVSSGYSDEVVLSKYKEFGFSAVLHKPYSPDELREVLTCTHSNQIDL
ncbi:MAG: ATP-binding protein [Fibrobacterota bacterium]|nr:ATP-binding protein [Chitinispirillaceae bacterium]